jgi:hypothetical protein
VNGQLEVISGSSLAELVENTNDAAQRAGYTAEEFRMDEDGRVHVGGASVNPFPRPEGHCLPEWGMWLDLCEREDGVSPREAWGGWVVQARTVDGIASRKGLELRDVITAVDGQPILSVPELLERITPESTFTVLRPGFKEVELR